MTLLTRQDAIKQKSIFYFTGHPCPNGHIANRYVSGFNCVECKKTPKGKKRQAELWKNWAKKNPGKNAENSHRWRKNSPEKSRESNIKGRKKYEKSLAGKLRRQCKITCRRLGAKKLSGSKLKLLNYTPEEFFTHLLSPFPNFKKIEDAWKEKYDIDHIVPIVFLANNIDDKEIAYKMAMDLKNLRLITRKENKQKGANHTLPKVKEVFELLCREYDCRTLSRLG